MNTEHDCALAFHGVSKRYGGRTMLDGVSFSVRRGRIYGFVGDNGAGKTTVFRIAAGLSRATSGTVEVLGESGGRGLARSRRKVGTLIERPVFDGGVTAHEAMVQRCLLYGSDTRAGRIGALFSRCGIGGTGKKRARDFSLGMKQRLGIALALAAGPELLLLDEPVNGLDPAGMVSVRRLLSSLCHDDGLTIVLSSHILSELAELATDYVFIAGGKIIRTAAAEEISASGVPLESFYAEEFQRAVQNLVVNAHRHNAPGTRVLVDVSVRAGHVRVTVADTGAPIPATLAPRLFQPFVTGDDSRTGGGTGLGLAIVREVAGQHGGRHGRRRHRVRGAFQRNPGGFLRLPARDGGHEP